jgi:hypothetical protein
MAYTTYENISCYLESKKTILERINAIDVLIDKMILSIANTIDGGSVNISEYDLDDTQVRVRAKYRSVQEVQSGIDSLEKMKQMYVNRYQGRVVNLVNEKSLRR